MEKTNPNPLWSITRISHHFVFHHYEAGEAFVSNHMHVFHLRSHKITQAQGTILIFKKKKTGQLISKQKDREKSLEACELRTEKGQSWLWQDARGKGGGG